MPWSIFLHFFVIGCQRVNSSSNVHAIRNFNNGHGRFEYWPAVIQTFSGFSLQRLESIPADSHIMSLLITSPCDQPCCSWWVVVTALDRKASNLLGRGNVQIAETPTSLVSMVSKSISLWPTLNQHPPFHLRRFIMAHNLELAGEHKIKKLLNTWILLYIFEMYHTRLKKVKKRTFL